MQQAGMIWVLDVLEHQLPVARNALTHVAQQDQFASVKHAVEVTQHALAKILLQRFVRRAEACEYHTVPRRHSKPPQPMFLGAEVGWHAALAAIPAVKRETEQIPGKIVGPLVIGTDKLLC